MSTPVVYTGLLLLTHISNTKILSFSHHQNPDSSQLCLKDLDAFSSHLKHLLELWSERSRRSDNTKDSKSFILIKHLLRSLFIILIQERRYCEGLSWLISNISAASHCPTNSQSPCLLHPFSGYLSS